MRFVLVALGALCALAASSSAQCPGPDNLNGPCWQSVALNIPQFPPDDIDGVGICWNNCAPTQDGLQVVMGPLVPTAICGQFNASITLVDPFFSAPQLTGTLVLDYTRTWDETDPSGIDHQVWRFVAKVDLSAAAGVIMPPLCPFPSCLAPLGSQNTAFYYGYVDKAQNCATGIFETVVALYHNCDWFIHKPVLSSAGGVYHPITSYGIVAPSTSANPFIPVVATPPGGPVVAEAVRNVTNAFGLPLCTAEELVTQGDLLPIAFGCICGFSLIPPQKSANIYNGVGSCVDPFGLPSSWSSLFILFPTLPWVHMVTTSMGCWANDSSYPGKECIFVNEGLFKYHDSCLGGIPGTIADFLEVDYGATTSGGWTVQPNPLFILTQHFTDMADNYSLPVGTPAILPIMGHVMPTDHLIYTNVP